MDLKACPYWCSAFELGTDQRFIESDQEIGILMGGIPGLLRYSVHVSNVLISMFHCSLFKYLLLEEE